MTDMKSWSEQEYLSLTEALKAMAEPAYKDFHAPLVPTIDPQTILGIRLPKLRRIAKTIIKENPMGFLKAPHHDYYEETMVHALVVGYLRERIPTLQREIDAVLPYIDNWAICDSFAGTLKIIGTHRNEFYTFISEYLHKENTYTLRFAIIALMDYYTDEQYIDRLLTIYGAVQHEDYYVKMAVAWGISVAFVKEREKTLSFLKDNALDDFTYNKALQKIIESNRVTTEDKALMRSLKRK